MVWYEVLSGAADALKSVRLTGDDYECGDDNENGDCNDGGNDHG